MSKKSSRGSSDHRDEFIDDFEDFGYEVKNIRRHSKKKVAKFKREQDEHYDSY
jgi:hypothetical protein|tara:strand:- start:714 stop:872 length:159 start_codon:yes stop_codon:yes gene_type:complete